MLKPKPAGGLNPVGISDFQAPPPVPRFIDTSHAIDELPSYDSFEPAPDGFQNPLPL